MLKLTINQQDFQVDVPEDTPLLWVIREELGLTGTKFGCGKGLCGACTVLLGDAASRTCILPVAAAAGVPITTIEGLGPKNVQVNMPLNETQKDLGLNAVQQAWLIEDVVQCGYCQSGQILAATALLRQTLDPTDQQIDEAMSANLCRCGTYPRIRSAVKKASSLLKAQKASSPAQKGASK